MDFGLIEMDNNIQGKSAESLRKSRKILQDFKFKHGKVPSSILVSDRVKSIKMVMSVVDGIKAGSSFYTKEKEAKAQKLIRKGIQNKKLIKVFKTSSLNMHQTLSIFPQDIGSVIVDLYCPERGVVYDPFAGHNSRMELIYKLERDYIGVDICKEFMLWNQQVKTTLYQQNKTSFIENPAKITLIEGNSSSVALPSNYADFTITSPPYWDTEYYGPEKEQLGNTKTYTSFLNLLGNHVIENYRILKPGAFCCWFVNDFRRNKKFYPYHIDVYNIFCHQIEFEPFNIYIADLGRPLGVAFLQEIIRTKLLPKHHEYILIFRKPS